MLLSKIVSDSFNNRYLISTSHSPTELKSNLEKALVFDDAAKAERFLRALPVPNEYWQKLLLQHEIRPKDRSNDSDLFKNLAQLLRKQKLKCYKFRHQTVGSYQLKSSPSYVDASGFSYSLQENHSQLSLNEDQVETFFSKAEAETFLQQFEWQASEIRELAEHSEFNLESKSIGEFIKSLARLVIEEQLLIVRSTIEPARPKPRKESVTETASDSPGIRQADLGVHSTDGSTPVETWFKLRLIDEVGAAISGIDISLVVDGKHEDLKTDGAGSIKYDQATSRFAIAGISDFDQLYDKLEPLWEQGREEKKISEEVIGEYKLPINKVDFSLRNEVDNTVVIKPVTGKLYIILKDKHGRQIHKNCKYSIDGPKKYSGTTDKKGMLLHEHVPPGDYQLTFTSITYPNKTYQQSNTFETPIVVLDQHSKIPQERWIGVIPQVSKARIGGALFDTNKSFLLPSAIKDLKQIRELYGLNSPGHLLLVGHTDTTDEPDLNDKLSLERADLTKAYLEDNIDAWLEMYDSQKPIKQRWGTREDRLMVLSLPDVSDRFAAEPLINWFQKTRNLTVDGISGPQTRTQLIKEYMSLDDVQLLQNPGLDIQITTHGCGENFPVDVSGEQPDQSPENDKEDRLDRRVEWFFFDKEFGILPKPVNSNGSEYQEWLENSNKNVHLFIPRVSRKTTILEIQDSLFQSNSCVVLPTLPKHGDENHQNIFGLNLFAIALRYNDEHPDKRIFISGHCDTTGTTEFNQVLSNERAQCTLAVIEGDKETFVELANRRHKVSDYKTIFAWCADTLTELNFKCRPQKIDDNSSTAKAAIEQFQRDVNSNKEQLKIEKEIIVDGIIGQQTWGAIFDVYEYALRLSLDETSDELDRLRANLRWVDPDRKALGFSEYHPIEKVNTDNFASKANRRCELLFFSVGDEPDLILSEHYPDLSEIYLPSEYQYEFLSSNLDPKRKEVELSLESEDGYLVPGIEFKVLLSDGGEKKGVLNENGVKTIKLPRNSYFNVEYLDHDKIRATVLAKRLNLAINEKKHDEILWIIDRPKKMFNIIQSALSLYYPVPGNLVDAIQHVSQGSLQEPLITGCLADLGILPNENTERIVIAETDLDINPDDTGGLRV